MNLYQVFPATSETFPLDTPHDREVVSKTLLPPSLPWVRAIMVTNSAGHTVDASGSSAGLSHGADRALLGIYRELSDVVIVGASTLRSERVPTPRTSALAIVSGSGDLSDHNLVVRDNARVFLVTTEEGAHRAKGTFDNVPYTPVVLNTKAPFSAVDVHQALAKHTPTQHVLVEGGRLLWETWANMTDEVCIAVTPPPLDSHAGIPAWWPNDTSTWELTSLMTDDAQMLYYRYQTGIRGAP